MRPEYKHSIFANRVRDAYGNLKHESRPQLNMRPNVGNNWQSRVMMGDSLTGAGMANTATATSATSLTGASSQAGMVDHLIVAAASGTGATTYGVITAVNTGTNVFTVDKWYDPTNPGGAAATTPSATSKYIICPGSAPVTYLAVSTTVQSGAAGDTTLAGELTTNGFARAFWTTYTHSANSSSVAISVTYTASGTETINSEGVFTAASSGTLAFENSEPNPPTLVSGDTLAQTVTLNY